MHQNTEYISEPGVKHKNGITNPKDASWDTLNIHQQYTKLYNALKDLEEYNVQISVPEFVFIGFQSSGKTSAVSQAAKLAVGTMKHGTASRCPTRFKLISNPKQKTPLIKVNGVLCKDEDDLTNKTLQITKQYEEQQIFCKDIIEVRIESAQVPELTFLDLPGLIKGNAEEWMDAKAQLDELTAHFLHDTNPDGTYRYIPIFVREPVDVEHDTHFEVKYIDDLVNKYGHGRKKRIGWRNDTIFIVNKFDKQINRSPAASLIEYMKYCAEYGQTVLTIMNAKDKNTATMTQKELNDFVDTVEKDEEDKWTQVLTHFHKRDDENLMELQQLKQNMCGVRKMNQLLTEKMCDIVKQILPSIERKLEAAEIEKRQDIAGIMKQIDMCDPHKLKTQCIQFNNKFLMFSRKFYNGECLYIINKKWKKSYSQEVDDFHCISNAIKGKPWQYEIEASKLQSLLSKLSNKEKPSQLLRLLRMELVASSAINRMIDAWQCQVAYMSFPKYSDEDLVNLSGGFMSTRQPDVWTTVRNVVLDAVHHLVDATMYLAEMMRYKLKENADIIFECTLLDEFGVIHNNNGIIQLLQRTLRDYKKEIDLIIDEFIALACDGPIDRARVLDRLLCQETINIGKLIYGLLNPKNKNKFIKHNKSRVNDIYVPPPRGPPPIKKKKGSRSPSRSNLSNGSRSPSLEQSSTDLVDHKQERDYDDGAPMLRRHTNYPSSNTASKDKKTVNIQYDAQKYDAVYFEAIYGQKLHFPVILQSNEYDINLIRHLSYVFWTNIKQSVTRDVVQKVSKMVMAPITQHDDRISNAIQCGVDRVQIQTLIDKLVQKTGVDVIALQKLIRDKSNIKIAKTINDLDNDELEKIYGMNRDKLLKQKEAKIKALRKYSKLKAKTLLKIYHIKNNEFGENIDDAVSNDDVDDID